MEKTKVRLCGDEWKLTEEGREKEIKCENEQTREPDLQLVFEKTCIRDSVVDLGQKSFDFLHSDAEEDTTEHVLKAKELNVNINF